MTRRPPLWAGLAALLTAAAAAPAATPPSQDRPGHPGSVPTFESLDRNGDNMISRPEAIADDTVDDQFRALDRDGDGDLDRAEFARFESGAAPGADAPMQERQPGDPRILPEPPNLPPPRR